MRWYCIAGSRMWLWGDFDSSCGATKVVPFIKKKYFLPRLWCTVTVPDTYRCPSGPYPPSVRSSHQYSLPLTLPALLALLKTDFPTPTTLPHTLTRRTFPHFCLTDAQLVVTTLESKFRTYDMRTQHPEAGFAHLSEKAHKSTVWLARHLPQNRDLFMTGGGNGGFNLYKYHYPSSRTKNDKVG